MESAPVTASGRLTVCGFTQRNIYQSGTSQGATVNVTVVLRSVCPLAAGDRITVAGLTGTQTPSTPAFPAAVSSGATAVWDQGLGQLTATLTAAPSDGVSLALALPLRLPLRGQNALNLSTVAGSHYLNEWRVPMRALSGEVMRVQGFSVLAAVQDPRGGSATAFPNNSGLPVPTPGRSVVTLTWATYDAVGAGGEVLFEGLGGGASVSNATLPISCEPPGAIASTAAFNASVGSLVVSISGGTTIKTLYTCNVSLERPATARPPANITASVLGATMASPIEWAADPAMRPLGLVVTCPRSLTVPTGSSSVPSAGGVVSPGGVTVTCPGRNATRVSTCMPDGTWSIYNVTCP